MKATVSGTLVPCSLTWTPEVDFLDVPVPDLESLDRIRFRVLEFQGEPFVFSSHDPFKGVAYFIQLPGRPRVATLR